MRYTFLIVNLFLYSSLLAPIFWYLWVYVGSGNANFFYAIGLVYGIGEIILMIDTTFAVSRRDFEALLPPETVEDAKSAGWDRDVIQIENQLKSTVTVKECGHHFCEYVPFSHASDVCNQEKLATQVQDDISQPNNQEEVNGTPMGSPVWTFDCGPTFSNTLLLSSSFDVEAETFPSLNTAMITHDRERIIKRRELKQEENSSIHQTNANEDHHQQNPTTSSENQPVPTFSQLQKLLSIHKDETVKPVYLQESVTPTQQLTFTEELTQSKDKEAIEFATPRMPSPSLGALSSIPTSYQATYDGITPGEASQVQARLSKKRRMQNEDENRQLPNPTNNKSSKVKSRRDISINDTQSLIKEDMLPSKAMSPKVPQERDADITRTLIDDDVAVDDDTSEKQEVAQVVGSSQPSLDVTMPSLLPNSGTSRRKVQRTQRSRDSVDAASPPYQDSTPNTSSQDLDHATLVNDGDRVQQQFITCIFTGLSDEQRESFDHNITRVIEAGLLMEHVQDQPFSESTTHIITNADSKYLEQEGVALCPRVLRYLHGMLSGSWILRHEWFVDSINAGVWLPLPQPKYMIQGDTQFGPAPGTQKRREIRCNKSMKLFSSCRMFFYGNFGGPGQKSITKDELLRLVRDGGAETWQRRPAAKSLSSSNLNNTKNRAREASDQSYFASSRSFLYVTEDIPPWEIPIDRTAPIIVCDPGSIPSGVLKKEQNNGQAGPTKALTQSDIKRHGWLRDYQAVSLIWLLNCISCSIMGTQDIELLYSPKDDVSLSNGRSSAQEEILELSEAWTRWRNRNRQHVHSDE
ncbi:hypothetical protein BGZ46_010015 [Entomortierella lignicola]|nr:hypothetical protein BGZ46_010015 [Entomortierella lignicola]